jgi:nicotinamide-nucleotide amidase
MIVSCEQLATQVGQLLSARGAVMTTAESCTGGGIAQAITAIAGSSQWFGHGFITYSNMAKAQMLAVPADMITVHGAVSQPVVEAMAIGAIQHAQADYAIAVSGIAGPQGGTPEKPVGTVWIAWKSPQQPVRSQKFVFSGDRNSVRNQAVKNALSVLIEVIQKNTV